MALEDLYAIDREFYASHICYFAEQTAEKSLKAVLAERGIRYPVKHDIGLLLGICKREGIFEAQRRLSARRGVSLATRPAPGTRAPSTSPQPTRRCAWATATSSPASSNRTGSRA